MGGEILTTLTLTDEQFPDFQFEAEICSWETCLWRLTVLAKVSIGQRKMKFTYENIDRDIWGFESAGIAELDKPSMNTLKAICELALIRAIKLGYYPEALQDGDLDLESFISSYKI